MKPDFKVATTVVASLTVLGVAARYLARQIPLPPPNRLGAETSEFLRRGAHEIVDWYPYGQEAFSLARRTGKPVFMVVGAPWSRFGRQMDSDVFGHPSTGRYLSRSFVCVRVDGIEHPEWLSAFLPLSRNGLGFVPGFQAWILDPGGHLVDYLGRTQPSPSIDRSLFLESIGETRRHFEDAESRVGTLPQLAQGQLNDIAAIRAPHDRLIPDFSSYAGTLASSYNTTYGGFPERGIQTLQPMAWQFLSLAGRQDVAVASLEPMLLSPMVDWVDGGFFRQSEAVNLRTIDFDKVATQEAEMAYTLALMSAQRHDPLYDRIGKATFDCLNGELLQDGLVEACVIGDEGANGRSRHSSLSPAFVRQNFGDLKDWAQDNLGLRAGDNPQMVPYLVSRKSLDPKLDQVVNILRRTNRVEVRLAGPGRIDVNGHVAACMLRAASLWNDPMRLREAQALVERLDQFRFGDKVYPSRAAMTTQDEYLGDPLAYADAQLADFLTSGRAVSLENGLSVLRAALKQYAGPVLGEYDVRLRPAGDNGPVNTSVPEVIDIARESCTAQVIRLCQSYGRLLEPSPEGVRLETEAAASMNLFASLLGNLGPDVASYYVASASVMDDGHAFCVGPNAVQQAIELSRRAPYRLVAPALGPVRTDLQRRPAGVYIVRNRKVTGPMSVADAVNALPVALDVGATTGSGFNLP